jgi:hypothetical protein
MAAMPDQDDQSTMSINDEMALLTLRWENLRAMFPAASDNPRVEAYRFACLQGASWVTAVQMAYNAWSRLGELLESLTQDAIRDRRINLAEWRALLARNERDLRALITKDRAAVGAFEELVAKALSER